VRTRPNPTEHSLDVDRFASLADVVRIYGRERPDKAALIFEDRTWSYAALDAASNRIAQALLDLGVGPEECVAILDKNTPVYFELFFGACKLNATTVGVNWRLAPPEIEAILADAAPKVLIIGEDFLDHLANIDLDRGCKIVVIGSKGGFEAYETWRDRYPALDPAIEPDADASVYQLYTSGTTGLPKGVQLTSTNVLAFAAAGTLEWRFDSDSVSLVALPLFHSAGSAWALVGLVNGASNVLLREVDTVEILAKIETHGVTNIFLVPAVIQMLLSTPGVDEVDFSTMRAVAYGGSPISEAVRIDALERFGCDFLQIYGLTEATGAVTNLRAEDQDPGGPRAALLGSAGTAWGDVELRIVNPDSLEELPAGEVGEIWVRSAQVMKGYWKNPEATAEALTGEGWLRTGDAGHLDGGFLFIHDRIKDMFISGGENVYPAEVENVLMGHPGVADVAVIGVPDERWGETGKAVLVGAEGAQATDRELIEFCRERLAHYKCPTSIERCDTLPRTPSGKVRKTELRERYRTGSGEKERAR
jgi:long-chain acyl-CoA synthetase